MIEIHGLTKTYKGGIQALNGIDLIIQPKGMFGILGVNGAGKTSLIRILAGLLNPTSGYVEVLGNDMQTDEGKLAAKVILGYLPQEMGGYPQLSAAEFLDYIAILKGVTNRKERKAQVVEVLEKTQLTAIADRKLKTYSGGMKRRVGIAQAMLNNPKLLIVDEPTSGLDPEGRIQLRNLLGEIAQNCAVILSTHIVEDINQSCSDMAVLWQGKILFQGSPHQLASKASGSVWTFTHCDNGQLDGEFVVLSTIQTENGTKYRILGNPSSQYLATPATPSLEDGYMWLMHQARQAVSRRAFLTLGSGL